MPAIKSLLEVRELRTSFHGEQGEVRAVDGVDFRLERGRTLGIVGESGCGKSVTALSIMGLVPQPPGRIAGGDKRGKQSAALIVCSTEAYADLNLRVDDHAEPLAELRRLYDKAHERFIPYLRCAPSTRRPWGETDRARIEEEIARYRKPA